jgi:hypothetical protein
MENFFTRPLAKNAGLELEVGSEPSGPKRRIIRGISLFIFGNSTNHVREQR